MTEEECKEKLKQLVDIFEAQLAIWDNDQNNTSNKCDCAFFRGAVHGLQEAKTRIEKMFELEDE